MTWRLSSPPILTSLRGTSFNESKIHYDGDSPDSGSEVGIILGHVSVDLALHAIVISSDEHESDSYIWAFPSGLSRECTKWPDVLFTI
jgi:hypothetical protein